MSFLIGEREQLCECQFVWQEVGQFGRIRLIIAVVIRNQRDLSLLGVRQFASEESRHIRQRSRREVVGSALLPDSLIIVGGESKSLCSVKLLNTVRLAFAHGVQHVAGCAVVQVGELICHQSGNIHIRGGCFGERFLRGDSLQFRQTGRIDRIKCERLGDIGLVISHLLVIVIGEFVRHTCTHIGNLRVFVIQHVLVEEVGTRRQHERTASENIY